MIWQDIIIAGATIGFIIGLAEQIYEIYLHKQSSISLIFGSIYSIGLYTMSIAMFTLNLKLSATLTSINALLWTIILILSIKYRFNRNK